MSKQTAVDWLVEQLKEKGMYMYLFEKEIAQAKQMEEDVAKQVTTTSQNNPKVLETKIELVNGYILNMTGKEEIISASISIDTSSITCVREMSDDDDGLLSDSKCVVYTSNGESFTICKSYKDTVNAWRGIDSGSNSVKERAYSEEEMKQCWDKAFLEGLSWNEEDHTQGFFKDLIESLNK